MNPGVKGRRPGAVISLHNGILFVPPREKGLGTRLGGNQHGGNQHGIPLNNSAYCYIGHDNQGDSDPLSTLHTGGLCIPQQQESNVTPSISDLPPPQQQESSGTPSISDELYYVLSLVIWMILFVQKLFDQSELKEVILKKIYEKALTMKSILFAVQKTYQSFVNLNPIKTTFLLTGVISLMKCK